MCANSDILDHVESYTIHIFLTRRLRLILMPNVKLIIFIQERLLSGLPVLCTGSTTLLFKTPSQAKCSGHFEFQTVLLLSSAFSKRLNFSVPDQPTHHACKIGTSKFFLLEPRNFQFLQIFKPPSKQLGSYKFHQSLLSRNPCLVLDSGSMPK